jgi:drug/metabolite transporter (DMT)-like permease
MSSSTPGDHAKVLAFVALLAIQTGVALLFKAAQRNGKYTFSAASAQTSAEVCKLCISAAFFARETLAARRAAAAGTPGDAEQPTHTHARDGLAHVPAHAAVLAAFKAQVNKRLLLHTGGLALLYCFNNQLAFALFLWADAASVTLIKSASSIVSAVLLWLLLARPIVALQWLAIVLQVLGLFIVQYDDCKHAALLKVPIYFALFVSLFISSAAGVWNEHVLKTFQVPLHVQNVCMYLFGVVMNVTVFCFWEQRPAGLSLFGAYFRGYHAAALGIIFCQAVLGLVITAALKYADMVIRSCATACSISVLYAVNVLFLGWTLNLTYLAGCTVVFLSTYMYMALGAANAQAADRTPRTSDVAPAAKDAAQLKGATAEHTAPVAPSPLVRLLGKHQDVAFPASMLTMTTLLVYLVFSSGDW